MSVWGIGAPRSGTLTLAYLLDGVHEPPPGIVLEAVTYWRTEGKPRDTLRHTLDRALRLRMSLGVPVVDPLHCLVLPAITAVDRDARFVVMVREPFACVRSLVARGTYVAGNASNQFRPAPRKGWPAGARAVDKCAWYWAECYRQILRHLDDKHLEVRLTEELPPHVRLNADNRVGALEFTDDELERIDEATREAYAAIVGRR